ncbi:MAG TPA: anti-sigma factor, partial [Thermoanaerobaculia bacterium]|nr:anti-sigma factor [Thermoanaerobaculia bacterium]
MAAPHSPRFEEMLPAYALGALDGEELRELEAHLEAGCPECEDQLVLWQGDVEALATAAPPLAPADTTRARLLRGLEAEMPPAAKATGSAGPVRARIPGWLGLVAAALLVVAAWGWIGQARLRGEIRELSSERDRLAQRAEGLDRQLGQAQTEAARLAQTLQTVAAPGGRAIVLAGLDSAPGASGRTFVDPSAGRAVFTASHLPALPAGKTYQLWFIPTDGKPVSAGVFATNADGAATLEVERIASDIQVWAVTIEPAGGVPQPTGQ